MLSLLCPAALAEYDKCERANGGWAGFDQVSKSPPVSEPTGKRASATSSDKTCTALQGNGAARAYSVMYSNNHVYVGGYAYALPFPARARSQLIGRRTCAWQDGQPVLWQLASKRQLSRPLGHQDGRRCSRHPRGRDRPPCDWQRRGRRRKPKPRPGLLPARYKRDPVMWVEQAQGSVAVVNQCASMLRLYLV